MKIRSRFRRPHQIQPGPHPLYLIKTREIKPLRKYTMSTNTMANPPTAGIESKSARKKKAKAEAATASSSQADVSIARKDSPSVEKMNGHHDAASSETSDELPAIKEIQK